MPYIFPKRQLRAPDVLDPTELNEDFIPAVEVVCGKLNAHNIEQTSSLTLETDGSSTPYYKYYLSEQAADPGFGASGAHTPPRASATDYEHIIRNDMEWDAIDSMSVSATTGLSTLWVTGRVQYIWLGFTAENTELRTITVTNADGDKETQLVSSTISGHRWSKGTIPCRVQFAVRVNGAVLPHTVTGKINPFEPSVLPVKAVSQRVASLDSSGSAVGGSRFPGPGMEWDSQATACGPEACSIRIGTAVVVQPGTHTVDIVARRVPPVGQEVYSGTGLEDTSKWEENYVAVFNRSLFVLDVPTFPPTASNVVSTVADTFDSEETISAKSLGLNKIDVARDALNSLEAGSLARGALCRDHLPSAVVAKATTAVTGDPVSVSADYPGWSTATKTTSSSGTGWYLLRDASSNQLKTSVGFSLDTTSVFIVLGNAHVQSLRNSTTSSDLNEFGSLVIGYEDAGGGFHIIPVSEAYINHYAALHGLVSTDPDYTFKEQIDVPLFAAITSADVSAATGGSAVSHFGIYAATMSDVGQPKLMFRRGNLSVIQVMV